MDCSALGDLYLAGGPNFPQNVTLARAAMDRGCAGNDHYAAGVCGAIGSLLAEGKLGAPPDRKAAMVYLERSCAQGYRCDLYVDFLLKDGRESEALKAFDQPRAFQRSKLEWAQRFCSAGHKSMCARAAQLATRGAN